MVTTHVLNKESKPTAEQIKEIEQAAKRPILIDDDAPSYSVEEMARLEKLAKEKKEARQKELISLRVDHESVVIAKSFGKGYTNLFSKLIYIGLRDPEILKRAL